MTAITGVRGNVLKLPCLNLRTVVVKQCKIKKKFFGGNMAKKSKKPTAKELEKEISDANARARKEAEKLREPKKEKD
jgi:hypothetical protein